MECLDRGRDDALVTTTVVIVDDHAGFRAFARALLQMEGFTVVGEAENGASALAATRRLHPDVLLLDIQLPDMDGFEVARRLDARQPAPPVVFISSREAADYGDRIEESGVKGFIPKGELSGAALRDLIGVSP
jgi:DNA-binding NarL/FixJ family response regulator